MSNDSFEAIRSQFESKHMPFLNLLRNKIESHGKIYQGLRIYHNTPLTASTMLKVEPLVLAGAQVIVSNVSVLRTDEVLVDQFQKAGVTVDLSKKLATDVDIYLDCSAEMLDYPPPNIGYVELTQTGSHLYKEQSLVRPVISVDDSPIKQLETFGTGDGFVRAIAPYIQSEFSEKKFVIFGYGKVGRGIHVNLIKEKANCVVVDSHQPAIEQLTKTGHLALHIENLQQIKRELKTATCVVTATGCEGLMSKFFDQDDLSETCLLANMGAVDEYGDQFAKESVLYDKKPLNFSLEYPTRLIFLDPVFYAHNVAIEYLLHQAESPLQDYNSFPTEHAMAILKMWQSWHGINLDNYIV